MARVSLRIAGVVALTLPFHSWAATPLQASEDSTATNRVFADADETMEISADGATNMQDRLGTVQAKAPNSIMRSAVHPHVAEVMARDDESIENFDEDNSHHLLVSESAGDAGETEEVLAGDNASQALAGRFAAAADALDANDLQATQDAIASLTELGGGLPFNPTDLLYKVHDGLYGMSGTVEGDVPFGCTCGADGMCQTGGASVPTGPTCKMRPGSMNGAYRFGWAFAWLLPTVAVFAFA